MTLTYPQPLHDAVRRHPHLLPAREVLGLEPVQETVNLDRVVDGLELDLVTHDLRKFMGLMLKPNGYVLEQLHSPLVVQTTPEHAELVELGRRCVTRFHAHHYLGFSAGQWKLLNRDDPPRVKPLLYAFRTLLTGLHLMRTGEIEANLAMLNAEARLPYLDDLMAQKTSGLEKETLQGSLDVYESEFRRLTRELEVALEETTLPARVEDATAQALSRLLVRMRLGGAP